MTLKLSWLQLMLFSGGLEGVRAGLELALEHIKQMQEYVEHLLSGGDPNEQRRDHWMTRADVRARYNRNR